MQCSDVTSIAVLCHARTCTLHVTATCGNNVFFLICYVSISLDRSVRAKHFLIHEDGMIKLSGLRSVAPMIEEGSRLKVSGGNMLL